MSKGFLLLALGAIMMGSCESNNYNEIQARQIDSTVNATVKQHEAVNAARNDSTLHAVEMQKAEAITHGKIQVTQQISKTKEPIRAIPHADTTEIRMPGHHGTAR